MPPTNREGLIWKDSGFHAEPCWQTEPGLNAIKTVCLRALGINAPDECVVKFMSAGVFNKLYLVEAMGEKKLVMRVSLPVDPCHKTLGEITTLRWIRKHTTIPVPEVIAFDDSRDNDIGFEWIIMEYIHGHSAYSHWRKLPMAAKKTLVEQIAKYQHQLLQAAQAPPMLLGIGTLTNIPRENTECKQQLSSTLGRIVSRLFFWGPRFYYDHLRGPFHSSYDWLDSCIRIIIQEKHDALEKADSGDGREDVEHHIRVTEKLHSLLPKIFPAAHQPAKHTVIWHNDLSLNNILVNGKRAITRVIDWEFATALPYWAATEMPQLLLGSHRKDKPDRADYANKSTEDTQARNKASDRDEFLDNKRKNRLY